MLPTDALAQLARYAGEVVGLRAHYPATATAVAPCLILFWSETAVEEPSTQTWLMTVKGQLLMARKGNTSGEIVTADALITPIVDRFSVNAADRSAYHLRTADGGSVDYCRVTRIEPSLGIFYAGHDYYGAELYFGIKLRRFAGSE